MTTIKLPFKSESRRARNLLFLDILYKFHKLTNKEMELVAELATQYQELFIAHKDPKYEEINDILFSSFYRKKVMSNLKLKEGVFHNYYTKLRRKKIIVDNKLSKDYIPPIEDFKVEFIFESDGDR